MPIVLCVDDSKVEQRLIGGILEKDVEWLVQYAGNGQEALELVADAFPDIVVTDLLMPDMNGLELVSLLRERYPHLPVILTTAHGNEALALDALQRGAASYVSKDEVSLRLVETIEQVLGIVHADRHHDQLRRHIATQRITFKLANDPQLIDPVVDRVQGMLVEMDLCGPTERMHVGIAIQEALLNAMFHGNLEIPMAEWCSQRPALRSGQESDWTRARRNEAPYAARQIDVEIDLSRDLVEIVVRDEGPGFDTRQVPAAADPGALSEDSGRGLVLMRNFLNSVAFNERGNEVRMTFEPQPARSPLPSPSKNGH